MAGLGRQLHHIQTDPSRAEFSRAIAASSIRELCSRNEGLTIAPQGFLRGSHRLREPAKEGYAQTWTHPTEIQDTIDFVTVTKQVLSVLAVPPDPALTRWSFCACHFRNGYETTITG